MKSKLWFKCNSRNKPPLKAKMDRGGLTSHGSAIQYNVTRQCGSFNENLLQTQTRLLWSTTKLLVIYDLVSSSCQVLQPFIECNIYPNVLCRRAGTENEPKRSLLYKNVSSKTLGLKNTIKINANQTIGRQYNFTKFDETSMQNEDFGIEFTAKMLFRGEQRWRWFMQSHSL
jgi:hypothetical protein